MLARQGTKRTVLVERGTFDWRQPVYKWTTRQTDGVNKDWKAAEAGQRLRAPLSSGGMHDFQRNRAFKACFKPASFTIGRGKAANKNTFHFGATGYLGNTVAPHDADRRNIYIEHNKTSED